MPGSDHLKSFAFGRETLEQVYEFIDNNDDAVLQRWLVLGQPDPDSVIGTVTVAKHSANTVIGGILEIGTAAQLGLKVFPLGIPTVDGYQIDFGTIDF